jgi:hypothetical protein
MLKKLLKSIFPITWLKASFVIYNSIRIRTIDKILFPEFKIDEALYALKRERPVYDDLNINEENFSEELRNKLKLWHNWTQDEYLLVFNQRCTIEPKYGWGLVGTQLIYPSLGFSRADYLPKPSIVQLFFSKKLTRYYPQIISLRDTGEENYFHFYNDILAKLCFLEDHYTLLDIPVLIAKKLYEKTYFQFYLKHSSFMQRITWVIQDDEFITTDKAFFCKPLTHTKKYFERIVFSLQINTSPAAKLRKIFLYRNPKRLRYISNFEAVRTFCKAYGFDIIDTDALSVSEQMEWFGNASHVIGIHGAGLVNIIYGRHSIKKVVEIFPPWNYAPFHYIMLSNIYGFEYDAVMGKKGPESSKGGFVIDMNELETKLRNDISFR